MRALDFLGVVLCVLAGLLALGLSTARASERDDPPARVGRLGDMQGSVWMYDPQAGEWQGAQRNWPITTGDRLSTERGARAEVRVGPSVVRLDDDTELEILELDDDHVRLQLHSGSLALHLTSNDDARDFEVVTVQGRLLPQRDGHYRVDRVDDSTFATAWTGRMLFQASDSALEVVPGQRLEFWRDGPTKYTTHEVQYDAFTNWARGRGLEDERVATPRYVSPHMTGWEDLDRNGRWESTPEYGHVWIPTTVAPGWAPYRHGRWAWVRPWGWTWVDDAPWGFAPFHYGRWVFYRNAWCWTPGAYAARPVYAPALVAWVGGPHVSVSIGIGSQPTAPVGWFPLAPREVYVPYYRASPRYVRSVNITHVNNVTVINQTVSRPPTRYVNRQVGGALTVVPADVMRRRQPVAPAVIHGRDMRHWVEAGPVRHDPPVNLVGQPAGPVGRAVVPPAPWRRHAEGQRGPQQGREGPPAVVIGPTGRAQPSLQHIDPQREPVGRVTRPEADISASGRAAAPPPHRFGERHGRSRHEDERAREPVITIGPTGKPSIEPARGGGAGRAVVQPPQQQQVIVPHPREPQGRMGGGGRPEHAGEHGRGRGSDGPPGRSQENRREQRQ